MRDNGELMARGLIQGLHADRERLEKLIGELQGELQRARDSLRAALKIIDEFKE